MPSWVAIANNGEQLTSTIIEGERIEAAAACIMAGYTEEDEQTFYLWAKYTTTQENKGIFSGFYVTQETEI